MTSPGETVTLTPTLAARWLAAAPQNGLGLNPAKVDTQIRAGKFAPGSPILVNEHGDLLNGRHRAAAVTATGIAIGVKTYVSPAAFLAAEQSFTLPPSLSWEPEASSSASTAIQPTTPNFFPVDPPRPDGLA